MVDEQVDSLTLYAACHQARTDAQVDALGNGHGNRAGYAL